MARQPDDKSAAKSKSDSKSDDSVLIRELALLLAETNLTEIEIERAGLRVRVARNISIAASVPAAVHAVGAPAIVAAPAAAVAAATDLAKHPGAVPSPMVGTAYLAAEPGAANFVKPGDRVALMSDTRYEWMLLDEAIWNAGAATVRVRTTWDGASGIGGFFERTFAPKGLRRIHEELLGNLAARLNPIFMGRALDAARAEALPDHFARCRILPAALGERLGDVAALCVALEEVSYR